EQDICNLLVSLIESSGENLEVAAVHSGVEALLFIGERKPDLVILDIMIPGMNGIDVCQKLRSNPSTENIKVVAITGSHNPEIKDRILDAGADLFCTKPLDLISFRDRCLQLIRPCGGVVVSSLDDPKRWAELDPQNMRSLLSAFLTQIREAWHSVQGLELKVDFPIASVLVSGLGGSAIGGDVVRTVTADVLRVPLLVIRDYGLPQFVNSKTVVFACSYSGNTEETLSSYEQARQAGAFIICISSGGALAERARAGGFPLIRIPAGMPPRTAL